MRIMKYFAILILASYLHAADQVKYDIGYGDSINTNVSYIGANTNLVLIGCYPNRMRFEYLDGFIANLISGQFVSRPNPDWIGAAVSNLNMGGNFITNISSLFTKNIFIPSDYVIEDGGVFSLGYTAPSAKRYITKGLVGGRSYGAGILGSIEGTSVATVTNSRGAIIVGYLNNTQSKMPLG